jgi:hypothetical protein
MYLLHYSSLHFVTREEIELLSIVLTACLLLSRIILLYNLLHNFEPLLTYVGSLVADDR